MNEDLQRMSLRYTLIFLRSEIPKLKEGLKGDMTEGMRTQLKRRLEDLERDLGLFSKQEGKFI